MIVKSSTIQWPTQASMRWTENFLDTVRDDLSISTVIAIGSAVRPNGGAADLDLVVICRERLNLKGSRPMEVDLRVYRADDVDRLVAEGHDVLGWAIKFGQVLFQRSGFWDMTLSRWKDDLPLPSPEIPRVRAREARRRFLNVLEIGDSDAALEQAISYLTHLAWAELLEAGIFPASRRELPSQLRAIDSHRLADSLDGLLDADSERPETRARLEDHSCQTPRGRSGRLVGLSVLRCVGSEF